MSLLQWLGVKTPPDPMEFINFCHVWVANNLQFLSINNFNAFISISNFSQLDFRKYTFELFS